MIAIMPQLLERIPNLVFVISGDGDDRSRLERLAVEYGVAGQMRFTGFVPHEDLPALYRLADLVLLAGFGEGFGIVLLGALACGVPVVASSRDGSREAVGNGGFARVVDPDDSEAFRDAILQALRNPAPLTEAVRERFGFDSFARRVADYTRHLEARR